ncbi:dihydrolipoyl dehydrogenase [Candidatus Hecatella orcuttiae]|jgi:dihydrolipoamide dehydrogenase|uniref:dihydrolipoyl dehydrogenase n=1 Tax=Candidatus Hecatella orcuttiae TaxID=1935119 RepID=UPI0028681B66|nr:dihydrolipoyl dehydrogenase [Candidatus Hecatella orcuttiae]
MASILEADVTVLGGGPGGYVAAIRAAQLGGKIVLVERDRVGGTCLNRGCIPTKVLMTSAEIIYMLKKAKDFGITVPQPSINLLALQKQKEHVVGTLVRGVEALLRHNGVTLLRGFGKLLSCEELEVVGSNGSAIRVKSKKFILAPGSRAPDPRSLGFEGEGVLNTDEALELEDVPRSLLVVGAGPSGLEFACIFRHLGSEVTVVEMMPQILPGEDGEAASLHRQTLEREGTKIYTETKLKEIRETGNGLSMKAVLMTGDGEKEVEAEIVIVAFGRVANLEGIGLEKAGVKVEKGKITVVNDKMETTSPGIYAVGDAIGSLYAHQAYAEGIVAAENAMGKESHMDGKTVPRCVFTIPELAAVGMTEEQARNSGVKIKVGRFPFAYNGRALTLGKPEGQVKVITEEDTGKILGVHIIGPHATELIAEAALAVKLNCTMDGLAETIHAHPTLSEAFKEAVLDAGGKVLHKI